MNKKIRISIILSLVIVSIIAVVLVVVYNNNNVSKLKDVYDKMIKNQTYTFTRYDLEEKNKIITTRKVDKTMIDMYNSGEHISTLILEGDTYLIFHQNKEYYIYANNDKDKEVLTDIFGEISNLEYSTGKEKIYGRTYRYEEYKGVSDFLIYSTNEMDTNTIKTRFYFKGKELVYLKTIYETVNKETGEKKQVEELQTVKVEYTVEDNVFTIPKDYAEN